MGACVSVDVKAIKRLAEKLNGYSLSSTERESLLGSLGKEIEVQTKERIAHTKTDPKGNEWKKLSEKTKRYAKEGSVLFREGFLLASIERQVSGWKVIVGSARECAAVHQFGFDKKNIPARPFLGLSTDDISDLEEMTESWLRSHIK